MARSDNPEWNLTPQRKFRIPNKLYKEVSVKVADLRDAGYTINDILTPGTAAEIDVAKVVRAALVQFADETPEQTVQRLGLVQKAGAGK